MDHLHEAPILFSSDAFVIREATPADWPQINDLKDQFGKDLRRDDDDEVEARDIRKDHSDRPFTDFEEPDSNSIFSFTNLVAVDTCDRTHAPKGPEDGTSNIISSSDVLIGFVCFTYSFVLEGKHIKMEELFVSSAHRSKGVGKELWRTILKIGLEEGAQSCRFLVPGWNAPAIAFYKRLGAQDLTASKGIHYFDMEEKHMENIVVQKALRIEGAVVVRPAQDPDMDEVLEMQQHCDMELEEHRNRMTREELSEVVFSSSPPCHLVVAEDHGGALLGFTSFCQSFTSEQVSCFTWCEVTEVYVKPSSRKQGVGSYLMQHVIKQCLSLGCIECKFNTASDSGMAAVLKKIGAIDYTKDTGLQVMYMDKDSMMKMVNCDEERTLGCDDYLCSRRRRPWLRWSAAMGGTLSAVLAAYALGQGGL